MLEIVFVIMFTLLSACPLKAPWHTIRMQQDGHSGQLCQQNELFSGRRDGDVLAGSCGTRNFDFCVAKHLNGERALEEPPSHRGGLGRHRGVISSHGNLGGNKAKLGLAWQSCVS